MNKNQAKSITDHHHLISGKVSRNILKKIQNNQSFSPEDIPKHISLEQIEQLRKLYQEKKKKLNELEDQTRKYVRHLAFYHIIKDKIPSYDWQFIEKKQNNKNVDITFSAPRIRNLRVSLLSLLLGQVTAERDTKLHRHYKHVEKLPAKFVADLSDVLEKLQIVPLNEDEMQSFVDWLQKGLKGELLNVFSPICPDYSVEKTDDPKRPYVHTFNQLGVNISLIAQRVIEALPYLDDFFLKYKIKAHYTIAMGDFEAWSQSNLLRLNITQHEFLKRLQLSNVAIKKSLRVPADVIMFTQQCNGYEEWEKIFTRFLQMFKNGLFGSSSISYEKLLGIEKARRPLYNRWYGSQFSSTNYFPQLLNQGAEYAAMGSVISLKYSNVLILGADHSVMSPFYNIEQKIPTLYLKRFYY